MTATTTTKEDPVYRLHLDIGTAGESAAGQLLGRYQSIDAALDALDEHAEHVWQTAGQGRGQVRYLVLADTAAGHRQVGGGSSFWGGPPDRNGANGACTPDVVRTPYGQSPTS
jgi:hypothetical protein